MMKLIRFLSCPHQEGHFLRYENNRGRDEMREYLNCKVYIREYN